MRGTLMKYEKTKSGTGVIRINTDTYLSFGSTDNIKMVLIRYNTGQCVESKFFPIAMLKLPKMCTKAIGVKNIKVIRELVRAKLVDGVLPLKQVSKIGEIINREGTS
jgi:hypothetical protein